MFMYFHAYIINIYMYIFSILLRVTHRAGGLQDWRKPCVALITRYLSDSILSKFNQADFDDEENLALILKQID